MSRRLVGPLVACDAPRPCPVGAVRGPVRTRSRAEGDQPVGLYYRRFRMIFIVLTVFAITATIVRIRRGLTKRQAAYLFVILLCAGLTLRSILFALGM